MLKRTLILVLLLLSTKATYAQVAIKKILVNRNIYLLPENKIIHLKPSENELLVEFHNIKNDTTDYYYRLLSNDNDSIWRSSSYPVAHFENLNESKYLFQIKKQNAELTEVRIEKEKDFLHESWFYPVIIAYGLILIGVGIYLFFLYNFRQKLKLQGVRNQIAADLHDEVGSNLNSIAIFVEVLKNKSSVETLPILEKIIESSKESISLMQDTVWTINPKNDNIEKLFERMQSFASQLLANSAIAFDFKIIGDFNKVNFTMEQRKNVYLIFKEAINNIVKHSKATKVMVSINKVDDKVIIDIEDNGVGFDIDIEFEGNGLQNFKTRAEEAELVCQINSKIGNGTKIKLIID